ncbi:hypothetical protein G3I01_13105 [Gramella sp. MT6]|uniref:hypothetical protein n=1 Tax=Gramella sp. MT6 TaxID=2705471 RepID=UPI001C5FA255|nr:hypothetical protein [Gramella sp. MT6]QYA26398.1 hypothetical protein G3I01_13105 [Gramella sp. MT6]
MKQKIIVLLMLMITIGSCKNKAEKSPKQEASDFPETIQDQENETSESKLENQLIGNYVDDGYSQKDEGYDWVSVAVTDAGNDQINIKVRSRADKKKPTCTFDATASRVDENTYSSVLDGKTILYKFEDSNLTISPAEPEFEGVLAFYCSGGASVAGTYRKINEELDSTQIDKTLFSKVLTLQDVGFNISSINDNGKNRLTVYAFGLEQPNQPLTFEIEGNVKNAEVEDLNSDGSPEVVVFTHASGESKKGNVYGFTTNNKKSMSLISFPSLENRSELAEGYQGHDEFALVETSLVRRFPIYENDKQTGKMRQISYKLKEGEAMRQFEVDQVNEF